MALRKEYPTDYAFILDAHCHLGPFRNFHIPRNDADGLVEVFDALGIDAGMVSAHASISSDFRLGNDLVWEAIERHPGRIYGYCGVNPNYPLEVASELRRCFEHPGFRGIKLHPELHDNYPLDGPNYRPVWEFAAERRVPVLSHTFFSGDSIDLFDRLAVTYPEVVFLLGHAGFDLGFDRVVALVERQPNVYIDLCGPLYFNGVLEVLLSRVAPERLLFGSDIPFINAAIQLGGAVFARASRADKEKVLGLNAARLFGIGVPAASSPVLAEARA